ncbi:cobalamin biosynthesis protein (cbiJ) [Methanocaldococcus jannaschii DSM 2661]|uniref:Cobalt-precorrin-6A reductase n=1 Tax=Methanocaldococcus jannaschii (strain ATCC 43067 / DSM 2661 / JAL-1 / JCM 10045 / NBRC 100440) TaxID=243232 RepID=CBIJ_METJA|nr:precorrin-6A reductase [Methanocaldococcus jannaschii]Q57972.1 RecName: Full=Cobalt-precorrin-6A reductase [Methanocaldococcus jannaschii DSM 2661]AAB98544.1 cobalamin biosynthesis protein (cbiJ) [Methanocaldococcus jannaschii DSM 2661]
MNLLLMGGTKDSVEIGKKLRDLGDLFILYTSTTDYGGKLGEEFANKVITKPLDKNELKEVIKKYNIDILVDATHPFAINASKNAIEVCKELNIKYVRFERKEEKINHPNIIYVKDFEEAARLAKKANKVFHMAGIKNLKMVVDIVGKDKVIARVLPISVSEALKILPQKQIVAMYGTFSKELNKYLIRDYNCDVIITKDSGESGGFKEKVYGALEAEAKVIVVERPKIDYPVCFDDIDELIKYIANLKI